MWTISSVESIGITFSGKFSSYLDENSKKKICYLLFSFKGWFVVHDTNVIDARILFHFTLTFAGVFMGAEWILFLKYETNIHRSSNLFLESAGPILVI